MNGYLHKCALMDGTCIRVSQFISQGKKCKFEFSQIPSMSLAFSLVSARFVCNSWFWSFQAIPFPWIHFQSSRGSCLSLPFCVSCPPGHDRQIFLSCIGILKFLCPKYTVFNPLRRRWVLYERKNTRILHAVMNGKFQCDQRRWEQGKDDAPTGLCSEWYSEGLNEKCTERRVQRKI